MGFLKNLFSRKPKEYVDKRGLYQHVACKKCDNVLRVRIDKTYDLNRTDAGFVWHKTLVCGKCFNKMETTLTFDSNYNVVTEEISGGSYVAAPTSPEDNSSRGFG